MMGENRFSPQLFLWFVAEDKTCFLIFEQNSLTFFVFLVLYTVCSNYPYFYVVF